MSEDEKRRKKERAAQLGDEAAAAAVEREAARFGEGVLGFLDALVGRHLYIEGVRINYRGILQRVLRHGDGTPAGLILRPCQRVSYFQRGGPERQWTYTHVKEHLVPYEMIHDVGEEAFAEGAWPELKE